MTTAARKAVFFGFSFRHHGPHTAFRGLARALSDQVVIDISPPLPLRTPHWIAWRFNWRWLAYGERRVKRFFEEHDRRVIHYFFPENTMYRAADWKGIHGLVATCHQPVARLRKLLRPGLEAGLRACDSLIVQCESHVAEYREIFPTSAIGCIPLGVDTDFFQPGPAPRADRPRILTIGNWLRDYATWARVVEALADQPGAPEFTVIALPNIIEQARGHLRINPSRVRFLCGISDEQLRDEYARATLFFLPLDDAMANDAILEALAMGTPTVVTDLPATRDYMGDAASYIPRNSPDAALHAVEQLLADHGRAAELGRRGRQRAEKLFAWERVAHQYRSLYRQVAENSYKP